MNESISDGAAISEALGHLADPPRAPAFIVTIYGDVVEPRGGMLWMGTLIECCAHHGLNESLVRTAVSRLVSAGQLEGERIGRKSYYGLTETARAEFREAARLLFDPPPLPEDWMICLSPKNREQGLPQPWTRLGQTVFIAPNRQDLRATDGVLFRARHLDDDDVDLQTLAAERWGLDGVSKNYTIFLKEHAPVRTAGVENLSAEGALALRLRLVHDYRHAALNDPRLPRSAYPLDWPGDAARTLFVNAYIALSKSAETYLGEVFYGPNGLLPTRNDTSDARLFRLRREAVTG